MNTFHSSISAALHTKGQAPSPSIEEVSPDAYLPSCFEVSDLSVASISAAATALANYIAKVEGGSAPAVRIDRALANAWFDFTLRPIGWELPNPWDDIAGDYHCRDGWIKLHTNAPHHRKVVERVLGASTRPSVTAILKNQPAEEVERLIVNAGGCAAEMRSLQEWASHAQGAAVAAEPLIHWQSNSCASEAPKTFDRTRPLAGLRVLDLTRVLAGPVATRFLAAFGADVLRIDPPHWTEPGVVPEVTVGKRCAGLDLTNEDDRRLLGDLIAKADIMVHGYRKGALSGLGFGEAERRKMNPALIDISLNAYGWTGPWSGRRGFDSLVQLSTGIADHGMKVAGLDKPKSLPVQALDHATGYLMAAAALTGIKRRLDGEAMTARLSLARTAALLTSKPRQSFSDAVTPGVATEPEQTFWGVAERVVFPVSVEGVTVAWPHQAGPLRHTEPRWPAIC